MYLPIPGSAQMAIIYLCPIIWKAMPTFTLIAYFKPMPTSGYVGSLNTDTPYYIYCLKYGIGPSTVSDIIRRKDLKQSVLDMFLLK